MRISDWSSDVCSSDLESGLNTSTGSTLSRLAKCVCSPEFLTTLSIEKAEPFERIANGSPTLFNCCKVAGTSGYGDRFRYASHSVAQVASLSSKFRCRHV